MKIEKAQWSNSESRVTMHFPIAKVNKEKRTVSGFATLDNLDHHNDVVEAAASERAFTRFRGNIREQHGKTAVGKMLDFHTEDFFDKESGVAYRGIYTDVYVSKGAEDTWQKVLDGTLTGFSIGGNIVNAMFDKDNEGRRIITDYDMTELSLVDSPANPLANILSIQKSLTGGADIFKGMAAETELDNVFWCSSDQVASTAVAETKDCVICNKSMTNIGWVEKMDADRSASISKVVDAYLRKDDAPGPDHTATSRDADSGTTGSGDTINLYPDQNKAVKKEVITKMADEVVTEEVVANEAVVADAPVVEEVAAVEAVAEEVEKSVDGEESADSFTKMLDEIKNLLDSTMEKSFADVDNKIQKSVDSVESARSEMYNAVKKSLDDFGAAHSELSNAVAEIVKRLDNLEKRADGYETDTAMKKSLGDVEITKSNNKKPANSFSGWLLPRG
jgi:hypothetical protein